MDEITVLNYLFEENQINKEQFDDILKLYNKSNKSIIEIIEDEGILKEEQIIKIISQKINVPYINLTFSLIDKNVISIISEEDIKNKNILPIFKIQNNLTVGMVDPTDLYLIDELKQTTNLNICPVLISRSKLKNVISQYFGIQDYMGELITQLKDQVGFEKEEDVYVDLTEAAEEAPIVKLVNLIIEQAVIDRASDIHIEPQPTRLRIRYRIDGVLHEIPSPPKQFASAIISRIKVLSRLDISEKRTPQDGRIKTKINDKDIDIRVSSSPAIFGEKIVMRLFDKMQMLNNVENLGLEESTKENLIDILKKNTGILLVTGPTGSGKTTSLYAALSQLDSLKKNIVTIEDPVEYQLENINQIEVNPRVGLTFANGLRSILRQDPDIIMVGEIRDFETSEIAIRSALTGHFVLSTLHTNNAPDSLIRLIDMGIEPYLIVSTLQAILAQRLVRVLCKDCKETFLPPTEFIRELDQTADYSTMTFYTSRGCKSCKYTGYKGRIGVFELLIMNDEIRELILKKASVEEIKKAAVNSGMKTLKQDALLKITSGLTSLDEALNVLYGV
ncbi:type II/IV secretion system protein [Candidatus Dependentiae bacterium]|nr:type II/IV secretion system protein [Candidatus Dependentiae bacterium]